MKWEISMMKIDELYKVTRRIPESAISETRMFDSKEDAKRQFEEWVAALPLSSR